MIHKYIYLVNCVFPFAPSPFGYCVNILIDFNNCGTVGYVCPANYTSCSAGRCDTAPDILLPNAIAIFTAALNGSVDDVVYNVALPFNITLYNITTNFVGVTTNGVSSLFDLVNKNNLQNLGQLYSLSSNKR
jgi:hypothetical protein